MFSRTVIGSLSLLCLVLFLLVNGVTLSAARLTQLVVPPPPIISPEARFGPVIDDSSGVLTVTVTRSEEHTSELQSHSDLVCRLLLEKKKKKIKHSSQPQKKSKKIE